MTVEEGQGGVGDLIPDRDPSGTHERRYTSESVYESGKVSKRDLND
jgi:hypothetical protein